MNKANNRYNYHYELIQYESAIFITQYNNNEHTGSIPYSPNHLHYAENDYGYIRTELLTYGNEASHAMFIHAKSHAKQLEKQSRNKN